MKGNVIAMAAAMVALAAGAYTVSEFKQAPVARLHVPAMPDSIQSENAFNTDQLLKARKFPTKWPETAGWTTMKTDSAGNLVLVNSKEAPELHTFSTSLRSERYAKGTLKLKSTSRAEVLVNGEAKISKSTADSIATEASAPIELLPENDYPVIVNVLAMPDDPAAPELMLEFVPDKDFEDVTVSSASDSGRRVGPLSTMLGERVSSVALSHDGKYMLIRYRETVDASTSSRRAVLTETATGKVISEGINPDASWVPGKSMLYYGNKGVSDYDIFSIEVPSMATKKIAAGVPEKDVEISPDGKYLFFYRSVKGEEPSGIMRRIKSPDDRIPGDRDRAYLSRYDIETGVETILTYGGATTQMLDMTRDGKKLLYMTSRQTPSQYPFYRISVVEMDMESLANDTIINDVEGYINHAIYSPDARQLFVIGGPDAFGSVGANYAPHPIGNNFDLQGYIYDIATGNAKAMTKNFDPSLSTNVEWNPITKKIYFTAEKGFYTCLYELDPATDAIRELPVETPTVRGFSIGDAEGKWLAYAGGSFTGDGEAYLLDLKSLKSREVDAPLRRYLGNTRFGEMEPWKFTASDGTEIDGYMCLPPDFDPSKKYPLIVYYYGGTSPTNATFYHLYSPQLFAARDYVVYLVNPSGTTGYGQEFSARHVNAWGKRTADDIIEGVKKFCADHPYVDDKKIGCLGASYGGFMTQYLLTQTDIFAAAMSHAGISNVTSYWGEGYWGYSYNSVAAAKSYPWTDPELFTKQGSLFNADKIHTPLLLLHGTVDTNVPIGESIQIFNALRLLGRDVEFITVQDENHVVSGYDQKLQWHATIMAWFAKWLQDDPRWWNAMYGDK